MAETKIYSLAVSLGLLAAAAVMVTLIGAVASGVTPRQMLYAGLTLAFIIGLSVAFGALVFLVVYAAGRLIR